MYPPEYWGDPLRGAVNRQVHARFARFPPEQALDICTRWLYPLRPLAEGATAPPLRVALLVDRLSQPATVRRFLSDIQDAAFAEIVLVVVNGAAAETGPLRRRLSERPDLALYLLYTALDDFLFRPAAAGSPRIDAPGNRREADAFAMADAAS